MSAATSNACSQAHSHSQWGEDLRLLPLLMCATAVGPRRVRRSFVELGANNGVSHSNTFMLERCHDWRGLLIEANPANFHRLNESARTATKLHAAVCASEGTVRFSSNGDEMAGAVDSLSDESRRKFEHEFKLSTEGDRISLSGGRVLESC